MRPKKDSRKWKRSALSLSTEERGQILDLQVGLAARPLISSAAHPAPICLCLVSMWRWTPVIIPDRMDRCSGGRETTLAMDPLDTPPTQRTDERVPAILRTGPPVELVWISNVTLPHCLMVYEDPIKQILGSQRREAVWWRQVIWHQSGDVSLVPLQGSLHVRHLCRARNVELGKISRTMKVFEVVKLSGSRFQKKPNKSKQQKKNNFVPLYIWVATTPWMRGFWSRKTFWLKCLNKNQKLCPLPTLRCPAQPTTPWKCGFWICFNIVPLPTWGCYILHSNHHRIPTYTVQAGGRLPWEKRLSPLWAQDLHSGSKEKLQGLAMGFSYEDRVPLFVFIFFIISR